MNDPLQVRNTAFSFLTAADRCFEMRPLPNGQFQMPLVPAVVCAAFGIELCLKAIISIEKGKATGHELHMLFIKLSPQSKATLATALSLHEKELQQKIGSISSAFVEWRYIYEADSASINTDFLLRFSRATARLLESLANPPLDTDAPPS
ncbi:MAG: hypothetical protein Q7T90_01960 [Thiobacillus sp.]|nr:hypothetical protein [Thiobacillus sp.]